MSGFVAAQNNSGFRFRSVGLSTVIDFSNDENKITYFTPRFNGFQLTASWTPRGHVTTSNSVGQGGTNYFFSGPADENTINTNGFDLGVSYSGNFDGVGLEVQAGVATAQASNQADDAPSIGDDPFAYNGGVAVNFSGFTVAASFAVVDDPLGFLCSGTGTSATCASSNEGESFNIGVGYSTGPWDFSLTYFTGEEEGFTAVSGDDENTFVALAASYTLGPDLRLSASVLDIDFDGEATGPADDNDGIAVVFGVHAGF